MVNVLSSRQPTRRQHNYFPTVCIVTWPTCTNTTHTLKHRLMSSHCTVCGLIANTTQILDKEAYLSACSTARESILKSRADHIKSELDEATGDVRATWRTAQRLLHSRHKVVYDDAQCAQQVSTFCQFFVDKVRRICDISATLQVVQEGRR